MSASSSQGAWGGGPLPLPIPRPDISLAGWVAPVHASVLTLSYVGGFYLSKTIRELRKDDPRVMRSRLKVATTVTALGAAVTAGLLWKSERSTVHPSIHIAQILLLLGLPLPWSVPTFLSSSIVPLQPGLWQYLRGHLLPVVGYPLALTMLLFAGPLYVEYLEKALPLPSWAYRGVSSSHSTTDGSSKRDDASKPSALSRPQDSAISKVSQWVKSWWNMYGLRNFVVGPATEEVIWRSCILSVSAFSDPRSLSARRGWLIFGTPLYFGLAHLHHAREVYILRGKTQEAARFACLQAGVQFAYTTLFGWYANWLWLRTGNVVAPLLSHIFCNIMGLPNPWAAAKDHPKRRKSIFAAHLIGIALFTLGLRPMTEPSLFSGSLYWL